MRIARLAPALAVASLLVAGCGTTKPASHDTKTMAPKTAAAPNDSTGTDTTPLRLDDTRRKRP